MAQQIGQTLLQSLQILLAGFRLGHAAVVLQGPGGCHQHHAVGMQAGHPALDVQKLLRTQIGAEAGLGDGIVAELQGNLGSRDGVAAMGNVGEGAAMDKGRGMLQGLHQIGLQGILQQGSHGALSVEIPGGDGLAVPGVGHHQTGKACLQVVDIRSQTQNSHHFGGHGDIIAILSGDAVDLAPQTVHHIAQLPVVHIHAPPPGDLPGVDVQGVALIDMVVQHGSQQVVGCADGVEIAGKVEVDILHGNHLCVAAAGCTALDAKDGAEGRLPKGYQHILADAAHTVCQTHCCGGLALTGRGGVDGGDQHQLAVGGGCLVLQDIVVHLGLVLAVLLQILLVHPGGFGHLGDGQHLGFLRDFDVCFKAHSFYFPPNICVVPAVEMAQAHTGCMRLAVEMTPRTWSRLSSL